MRMIKISKDIFSKKVTDYTFAILFFLIFSIFIVFAIRPSLTTVFSLKKEEADLKKIDSLYEERILSVVVIQSQMEENRDYLPLLNQAISSSPQVNKMIDDIKEAADKNSFLIKKATVSDVNLFTSNKKNLETVKASVEATASFEEFLRFMESLFAQRRLKTIKKIAIASDTESTTSAQLKITLDVEGYYL